SRWPPSGSPSRRGRPTPRRKPTRDSVSGRNRKRACGVRRVVRTSYRGRQSRRGKSLTPPRRWIRLRSGRAVSGHAPGSLPRRLRRPRHGVRLLRRAAFLRSVPRPETRSRVGFLIEAHRQRRRRAEGEPRDARRLGVRVEAEVPEPVTQRREQRAGLELGQVVAEAEVLPEAERQVVLGPAVEVVAV